MEKNDYLVNVSSRFKRELRRIAKKDRLLEQKIIGVTKKLAKDPLNKKLGGHVVVTSLYGRAYSSRVNGDVRILWIRVGERELLLLRVGGHSGSSKVYK